MGVGKWEGLGITKPSELFARRGYAARVTWRIVVQNIKVLLDLIDAFTNRACIIGIQGLKCMNKSRQSSQDQYQKSALNEPGQTHEPHPQKL